ncbi:MAG: T9SS type A sorting domain-containing protein [Carboxylicivirga sp.]|jgi:ELWxxDGT repeat protein|nr:T9SS type A sorting domain-containing protein [Carboxylicivirga sp.]
MKTITTLMLLVCTLMLNAQSYSFEKTTDLDGQDLEDASDLILFEDELYFTAREFAADYSSATTYLCKLDSDNKAVKVTTIDPDGSGSYVWQKAVAGNKLFFTKKDNQGNELWYTENGVDVTKVSDIYPGLDDSNPSNFMEFNGKLYFNAYNETDGSDLFACDLTTLEVTCINVAAGAESSYAQQLCVYNNKLYFLAMDETHGAELWMYNGTDTPSMVQDLYPGVDGSMVQNLIVYKNNLYFSATTADTGYELFKYDGSTISLAKDINPGTDSSEPKHMIIVDDQLYLSAYVDDQTRLCAFDGSNITTVSFNSPGSTNPQNMKVFDGKLFGYGYTAETGSELFFLNEGTPTILDIDPSGNFISKKSSKPQNLTVKGDKLYFIATVGRKWDIFMVKNDNATPAERIEADVNFAVAPNPATNYFSIVSSNNQVEGDVQIFDLSGKMVLNQRVSANNKTVNIERLQPGLYIVSFRNGTQSFTQKLRIK